MHSLEQPADGVEFLLGAKGLLKAEGVGAKSLAGAKMDITNADGFIDVMVPEVDLVRHLALLLMVSCCSLQC